MAIESQPVARIDKADIAVIVIYFVIVLAIGLTASFRAARGTVSGYFLAGRNMHFLLVGASLFGSNIGSGHFVGLAGSAAAGGLAVAGFELNAIFILMVLGWLFVPVYTRADVYTMPEYLEKRFGGKRIQVYLSCLALLLYIFTKISADLFAGALFIKESFQWNLYMSIGLLLIIAAVFTVLGGLTAVLWTDAIQVVIMVIGAFVLMAKSFNHPKVGGFSNLRERYMLSVANISVNDCGNAREDSYRMLRSIDADLPGLGMTIGLTISAVWYWCSDQVIVQRVLSAKNFTHAKAGCVFAGALKILPLFLIIFPGMAARVIYIDTIGCGTPEACEKECKNPRGCSNKAYPTMVMDLMDRGLRGLMLAVVLSALMSSLTSIFNSASTLFTIDIWPLIRKRASETEKVVVGKLFVVVLVMVSILWIPIINTFTSSRLFDYIQSVTSFLAPPVCAAYVGAVFCTRVNEEGAFAGLMVGLVVGLLRFFTEIAFDAEICGGAAGNMPNVIKNMHYLHFGILLFAISFGVIIAVSYLTEPMPKERLHRLTFWTRNDEEMPVIPQPQGTPSDNRVYDKQSTLPVSVVAYSAEVDSVRVEPAEPEESSKCKRFLGACLGINQSQEQPPPPKPMTLEENPHFALACDVGAILVCAVAVFLYGYYE